jgi:hypothetical protein
MGEKKLYAVRPKDTPGGFIGLTECAEVEVSEICRECWNRGVIWHVHGDIEEHRGSESFKKNRITGKDGFANLTI